MLKPMKAKATEQYEAALARIYELIQTEVVENSSESDELEVLSILVKEYETEHYPIPSPNPH